MGIFSQYILLDEGKPMNIILHYFIGGNDMIADTYWKLFKKTGNIEYYIAYKDYQRQISVMQNPSMPYFQQNKMCQ